MGNLKDLKEEISPEEMRTRSALCKWDSQDRKRVSQGTSTIKKYFEDQDPICSLHLEATSEGKASLALLGKESDLATDLKAFKEEIPFEETVTLTARCHINRQEHKRKRQPGTSSILKFFQQSSSSQSPQNDRGTNHNFQASSARDGLQRSDINDGMSSCSRVEPRGASWDYKIDEVDLAVVDELPREIQDELRLWLHPQKRKMACSGSAGGPKRSGAAKRCPSIASYFLPLEKPTD